MSSPLMTPIPTRPAASAAVASGGSTERRGSTSQSSRRRVGCGSARSASSRRCRAASSTETGRRASATIHCTYGSRVLTSSSVILDSLPPGFQSIACPLHPHFQRRNSNSCQRRHFLITQLFYVLEQECFAKQGIQLGKHTLHQLFIFSGPCRAAVGRVEQEGLFTHEHPVTLIPTSRDATALIYQDPIQPRTELVPLLILPERSIRPQESRLQGVLRVVPISEHAHGKTRAALVVAIHQT